MDLIIIYRHRFVLFIALRYSPENGQAAWDYIFPLGPTEPESFSDRDNPLHVARRAFSAHLVFCVSGAARG